MKWLKLSCAVVASLAIALPVHAEELTGRLKRIKDNAIMVISHAETTMPFSYVEGTTPLGFGVDISKRIAESIRTRLELKELRIRWNPVTLSTRFPLITTNTTDLECVTTTHSVAREKLAAFSNSFYIANDGIAVRKESSIRGFADLAGKRVAVAQNTTTEAWLKSKAISAVIQTQRSNRAGMIALADGEVDAFVAATPILAGQLLRLPDANLFRIVNIGDVHEAFACMMPKDDPAYKAMVDQILADMMISGEMERLYNKWFMQPIPPLGRVVGLPLDAENRQLYLQPNDRPLQ